MDLTGRVVVITGAGSGSGRATAYSVLKRLSPRAALLVSRHSPKIVIGRRR